MDHAPLYDLGVHLVLQQQQQQLLFLQRIESAGLLPKIVAHLGVLEISRASGGAAASVLHDGTRPGNHILVALLV